MKRIVLLSALLLATSLRAQEPAAPRVYELGDVETQPVPTNLEALRAALAAGYPAEKQAAGQGATVSVAFVLGPDGTPRDLGVTQSTDAAFDSATIAAMTVLRFTPATVGGQPVAVRVEVPVQWRPGTPPPAAPSTGSAPAESAESNGLIRRVERSVERVYQLRDVDELPRLINGSSFSNALHRLYPADLRRAGIGGEVVVRFVVTEEGTVTQERVVESVDPRFSVATLEAVRTMRFRPARVNGQVVATEVDQPIRWMVDMTPPPIDPRDEP